MILAGDNYNIRNPSEEMDRLKGGGLYNQSRSQHFSNLSKSGGNFNKPAELEYIERSDALLPRERIYNKTLENTSRSISGLSTEAIKQQRSEQPRLDAKIILANTKRQMGLTQQLLPN